MAVTYGRTLMFSELRLVGLLTCVDINFNSHIIYLYSMLFTLFKFSTHAALSQVFLHCLSLQPKGHKIRKCVIPVDLGHCSTIFILLIYLIFFIVIAAVFWFLFSLTWQLRWLGILDNWTTCRSDSFNGICLEADDFQRLWRAAVKLHKLVSWRTEQLRREQQ